MSEASHVSRFRAREGLAIRDVQGRSRMGRRSVNELPDCAAFRSAGATTHRTKSSTIQSRLGARLGNEFQGMNCSSRTTTSGSAGPSMHAVVRVCKPSTVLLRCSALGSGMPRRSCSPHRCRETPHACQRSCRLHHRAPSRHAVRTTGPHRLRSSHCVPRQGRRPLGVRGRPCVDPSFEHRHRGERARQVARRCFRHRRRQAARATTSVRLLARRTAKRAERVA